MMTAQAVSMGMEAALNRSQPSARVRPTVANHYHPEYSSPVPANSGAGCASPNIKLAQQRPKTIAGAIFSRPQCRSVVAVRGRASALPGANLPGLAHPRTAAAHHVQVMATAPKLKLEHHPMKQDPARNPSALRNRAAAHRAMALTALRADSSLSVRLARYNAAMAKARALEAEAERQQTRSPHTALAWLKAGKSVHIDAVNLRDNLRHVRALAALEAVGGEA